MKEFLETEMYFSYFSTALRAVSQSVPLKSKP